MITHDMSRTQLSLLYELFRGTEQSEKPADIFIARAGRPDNSL